jgi:two-component system, cell cycle response regulator DivK
VKVAKILLVEDNELNRDMLSRRLERRGYQIVLAVDGKEGVEKAASEHPDVVLMDMDLPVVDGWDATRMLRADPRTAGIPVIALTAHALVQDRERALLAGCNAYQSKPVDFAELLSRIEELLANRVSS